MKSKRIIVTLLIVLLIVLSINKKSYAVTPPVLTITSNIYSEGDKIQYDDVSEVEEGKTLQLYAIISHGSDVWIPGDEDSIGWFVDKVNLSGGTWTSSNESIATVDNNGKVTGVSEGTATITAHYSDSMLEDDRDAIYEITVKPKSNTDYTGIAFYHDEPGPGMILGREENFSIGLYNIPETEKENIKFKIENESIAQIVKTEYDKNWAAAIATVKYLSVGKTKLIATLNYNGTTYSATYDLDVIASNLNLIISSKDYAKLPETLKIGEKLQLTATLEYIRGSLAPEDVTSDGVIWTSNDEKIVKVDNKGLITAMGKGTATITAKYETDDGTDDNTVLSKYVITILDPNDPVSPASKDDPTVAPTKLPQTGISFVPISIGICITMLISILMFKKHKNYKDIK